MTWELPRFAAASLHPSIAIEHQVSAQHVSELLRNEMRVASILGAQTLVTESPVGMARLLQINGFHAKRAGVPMMMCGMPITVLQINCALMILA